MNTKKLHISLGTNAVYELFLEILLTISNDYNVFSNKCAIIHRWLKLDATKEVRIAKFKESKNDESDDSMSMEPVICLLVNIK